MRSEKTNKIWGISPKMTVHTFIDYEELYNSETSRGFEDKGNQNENLEAPISKLISARVTQYSDEKKTAIASGQNFLLATNGGVIAGIFALGGTTKYQDLSLTLPAFFFFLSLLMLAFAKWMLIERAFYLDGEFFKNTVRYYGGKITAVQLIDRDYRATRKRSYAAVCAAASLLCFALGWLVLFVELWLMP